MCSIIGIGFQKNHTISDKQMVSKLVTKLLINGMLRGKTATGLCYVSNKEVVIVKNKLNAKNFTETEFYKDSLKKYIRLKNNYDEHLFSIIGHCRQKTKGTELNNDNNHPISYGNTVGVHNGIIGNDDEQFNKYKDVLPRKARVDSEIIFALINHFTKTGSIAKGIQKACNHLIGSYACSMVHCYQPHILWLFRATCTCTIYHFKEKGIIIFASLPTFITDAVSEFSLGDYEEIPFGQYVGIGIDLYKNNQQRFGLGHL